MEAVEETSSHAQIPSNQQPTIPLEKNLITWTGYNRTGQVSKVTD